MKTQLDKFYDEFTPIERLNLTMAAITRCDDKEKKKLFSTCDKKYYIATDREFVDKYDAMFLIVSLFFNSWKEYLDTFNFYTLSLLRLERANTYLYRYCWVIT